jgi:hypothetical protein
MRKFSVMPVMAIILKVSAVLALVLFIGSLYVEIGQFKDFLKQVKDYVAANPVDSATLQKIAQQKMDLIKSLVTNVLFLLGIPSFLWLLADGALLLRAMYFGDDCCDDEDGDGCCCGHDHSEAVVAPTAPVLEKSAE